MPRMSENPTVPWKNPPFQYVTDPVFKGSSACLPACLLCLPACGAGSCLPPPGFGPVTAPGSPRPARAVVRGAEWLRKTYAAERQAPAGFRQASRRARLWPAGTRPFALGLPVCRSWPTGPMTRPWIFRGGGVESGSKVLRATPGAICACRRAAPGLPALRTPAAFSGSARRRRRLGPRARRTPSHGKRAG